MIIYFLGFIILLALLFFLSRSLSKNLYFLFYLLTKDKEKSISLLTWVLLPGTVIHELSHLLVAELLRVQTGELNFKPIVREGNEVRAGGLKIAKTDPLRHSLIGLAPTVIGLTIISLITHFYLFPTLQQFSNLTIWQFSLLFPISYLLLTISNTMFSSKKDLEPILFPIILILVISLAFKLGGIKISLEPKTTNFLANFFKNLDLALLGVILIDLGFLGIIRFFLLLKRNWLFRKSKLVIEIGESKIVNKY